ncbi:DUF2511 domain-containing protein [Citrobacter freundii]|uniref:DUF2511 domain-containing protein n=1 Tax=Citrobacter freundii TaxID=546 RepID=UPI001F2E3147|nr:DUF2511 domain-containing protein [Citrobacter freundii]
MSLPHKKTQICLLGVLTLMSTSTFAIPFKGIERSSFNGTWPFSSNEVQLQCLDNNVYVMNFDDNKLYALSGAARVKGKSFGALPLEASDKFWLDDKSSPGLKVSLSDVTNAAFELCDK